MSVLRPELFRRLKTFSGGNVSVACEGEAMNARVVHRRGRDELQVVHGGEYYRISCPYCNDTRRRLWLNHRWGLYDPASKSKNLFLAICYNENCLSKPGRSRQLYDQIFTDFGHESNDKLISEGKINTAAIKAEMPGMVVPLKNLEKNHHARLYMKERGYDPVLLCERLNLSYCIQAESRYATAQGRIIIPIYNNKQLCGWQARYIGTPPSKDVPKYYSMPGMHRNSLLYNYDEAVAHPYVVVCEGPSDVWSYGPEAVALFGKTASSTQIGMITQKWKTVYIVLDSDAEIDAQGLYDQLGNKVSKKILVKLPKGYDPGSIPTATLRNLVLKTK